MSESEVRRSFAAKIVHNRLFFAWVSGSSLNGTTFRMLFGDQARPLPLPLLLMYYTNINLIDNQFVSFITNFTAVPNLSTK